MNKILVSDIIDLESGSYILNLKNKDITLNIDGNVTGYLIDELIDNLIINLKDASTFNLYIFNKCYQNNSIIKINQFNYSNINLNMAYLNNDNVNVAINNNIYGNNNNSKINVRNISNNDNSKIIINVKVDKNTSNNIALEDLKGINNGGLVHIEPNIEVYNNEVVANHLTTIGSLDKDSLNYLMSKGINMNLAKEILLKGFIYSNMDDYITKMGGDNNA